MRHLTSEELSAHLDGALAGRAAEEAERHLAACEECREALASLAAQDAALKPTLTHDPGDAYFESFAGRVGDRIRAAGLAGAQQRGQGFDLGRLLGSPRTLAWAGGVAVLVVGAGLALMTSREVRPPDLRDRDLAERGPAVPGDAKDMSSLREGATTPEAGPIAATDERERDDAAQEKRSNEAPPSQDAPRFGLTGPTPATTGQKLDRPTGPPPATAPAVGQASPGRAVEVQRNQAGEDVPVRRAGESRPAPAPPPATTGTADELGGVRKKTAAEPLKGGAALGSAKSLLSGGLAKSESAAGEYLFVKPPDATAPSTTAGERSSSEMRQALDRDALVAGEARLCGEVRDTAGRPIAGAQITVADIGRTATSDAQGTFCVAAPTGEHPLSVMAVGFAESRQTVQVGPTTSVRVTLEAVSVMEEKSRSAIAGRVPPPRVPATPPGEPRDSYSRLPDTLRAMVRAAQHLETNAASRRSARQFDAAATEWARALRRLEGGPLELETRWHLAGARYRAWEAAPTSRRASAAVEALTAYAVRAPAGAQRDQATRWLDRVGAR